MRPRTRVGDICWRVRHETRCEAHRVVRSWEARTADQHAAPQCAPGDLAARLAHRDLRSGESLARAITRAVAIQFPGERLRHGSRRGPPAPSDWSDFRAVPPARR